RQQGDRSVCQNSFIATGTVRRKFLFDEAIKVGAFPARTRKQSVRIGKGADAAIERADIVIHIVGAGETHDRLDDGNNVARAVIDFLGQQDLTFLGTFAFSDIGSDAAEPDEASFLVEARYRRARAPANFTVRSPDAKLGLQGIVVF